MSFTIQFMYNNQPKNKITKNPVSLFSITGELRAESNVTRPVILIESASSPVLANYAYIADFYRYYFVVEWKSVRTGLWEATLHTDVLKTFSEGILGSPCIVARSSNRFNLYLNDDRYKANITTKKITRAFPSGFQNASPMFVVAALGEHT